MIVYIIKHMQRLEGVIKLARIRNRKKAPATRA